jgi:hypothetical protein
MKYHDFTVGHPGVDDAIDNYLMFGIPPGGFTMALLANDLYSAINSADHQNRENLREVVQSIRMWMPGPAYGSYKIISEWMRDKDGRRTLHATRQEKLYILKVIKGNDKK